MKAEAKARRVDISIICDFVYVLDYIWAAAWCFFNQGDPTAEQCVADKALAVLAGKAGIAAGAIARGPPPASWTPKPETRPTIAPAT